MGKQWCFLYLVRKSVWLLFFILSYGFIFFIPIKAMEQPIFHIDYRLVIDDEAMHFDYWHDVAWEYEIKKLPRQQNVYIKFLKMSFPIPTYSYWMLTIGVAFPWSIERIIKNYQYELIFNYKKHRELFDQYHTKIYSRSA